MARPKLYDNVEKLEKDINEYFKMCDKKDKPYTMSGLALALNMSRQSVINYSNDDKFFDTIKKARQRVEAQLEENALMNKYNPTFTIFNLKNNFNWKDKQEHEISNSEGTNQQLINIAKLLNEPQKVRTEEDINE